MAESINYQIGGINNQIADEFATENDLAVTGGGRGWVATTTRRDGTVASAKGTSKLGAAQALYEAFKSGEFAGDTLVGGPADGEIECNSAECMASRTSICACKCEGRNHGFLSGERGRLIMTLGVKFCACGCGEETQRRFVPGHDARYHTAQKAQAAGLSVEAYRAALVAARNERAAAKRRAKRAAAKAAPAPVAKPRKAPAGRTARALGLAPSKSAHNDDLPF